MDRGSAASASEGTRASVRTRGGSRSSGTMLVESATVEAVYTSAFV